MPGTIPETFADLRFPIAGIDLAAPFTVQAQRTTPLGKNVRAYDAAKNRARGGARPGLAKYLPVAPVANWLLQDLHQITGTGDTSGMQTNSSGRIVQLVTVSQGNVYYATAGDTTWTLATNNTGSSPPLNFTGIVRSAPNSLKLFFVDGTNYRYYNAATRAVETWSPTAGSLPVDGGSNRARLICTWRGRTVLSGLLEDPQNFFMSAQHDPFDFDYSPESTTATQAVAGNLSPAGLIGDVITSLCPYSDDMLIFFGDHTIYMMRGDPLLGGQVDLISDVIGGAWGVCWAKDPYGAVYFFSNQTGIYRFEPRSNAPPQRISQQIEQLLKDVNTGTHTIRLVWNDRFQGLHVFVTPTATAAAATHYFFEHRTGAWWVDEFANKNHNPLTCLTFDGNLPTDRVALIGCWDGFVRSVSSTATKDDGYNIASEVIIGPLLTADTEDMMLKELQAILGEDSGDVNYAILVGPTAEAALESTPVQTGVWKAGRNLTNHVHRTGHAVYVRLTSTNAWAMEQIRAVVAGKGKVRKRGY